jgi:hypothetical protein
MPSSWRSWQTVTDAQGNLDLEGVGAPLGSFFTSYGQIANPIRQGRLMHSRKHSCFLALVAVALLPASAGTRRGSGNMCSKARCLGKGFHTTTANVEFDTIQTDPIPDTDV